MDNKLNSVYDKDSEKPIIGPDLKSLEQGSSSISQKKPSTSTKSVADQEKGKTAGASSTLGSRGGATGGVASESGLAKKSGKFSSANKLFGKISQNKKKFAIGGGILGTAITLMIVGSIIFIPLMLEHIGQVILAEESALLQRFEGKAANEIEKELIKHACGGAVVVNGVPVCTKFTEGETDKAKTGNKTDTLVDDTENFDWSNEHLQSALGDAGLSATVKADGSVSVITDSSGTEIYNEATDPGSSIDSNTNGAADKIAKGLPEYRTGQLKGFNDLNIAQAHAPVEGFPEDTKLTPDEQIESEILSPEDPAHFAAEITKESLNGVDPTSDLGKAIAAAEEAMIAGQPEPAVIDAAKAKISKGLGVLQYLSILCQIYLLTETLSRDRIPTIITLLIRHSAFLTASIGQMKEGKLPASDVNALMNKLQGTSADVKLSSDGKTIAGPDVPSTSFSNSEAWQTAIGNNNGANTSGTYGPLGPKQADQSTINGLLPDPSSIPNKNSFQALVDDINSLFDFFPGLRNIADGVCGVLTNNIVSYFLAGESVLEAAFIGLSSETVISDLVKAGIQAIAITVVVDKAVPYIIKALTPLGIYGLENGAQWLNNADMGANLSYGNYSRKLGANPVSYPTANNQIAEANLEKANSDKYLPIADKLFALSNTNSLLSRVMNVIPFGKSAIFDSMISYFTNFPKILSSSFGMVFSPSIFAAASAAAPGQQYGITQYSFQDSEVTKYNIYDNEAYLYDKVTLNGVSKSRLEMLGNPYDYINIPADKADPDQNSNDLEHCYVDSYTTIQEDLSKGVGNGLDQNCTVSVGVGGTNYTIGDFDSSNINNASSSTLTTDLNFSLDLQICYIYTNALKGTSNQTDCNTNVKNQIDNDIVHLRQYMLDVNTMGNFKIIDGK